MRKRSSCWHAHANERMLQHELVTGKACWTGRITAMCSDVIIDHIVAERDSSARKQRQPLCTDSQARHHHLLMLSTA